jgi:hypothetical protein
MNIEVKVDSTHTFTYTKVEKNTAVSISTATIAITDAAGKEILAATGMTISGNVATYNWDSTGQDIGSNYIVNYVIDSECINRFFDIYYYPFLNKVVDSDLFALDDYIKKDKWEVSGSASSGSTSTLIDLNLGETDDYYNGGVLEIMRPSGSDVRTITDYDAASGKITFSPVVTSAVADGTGYAARKSYQDLIDEAGELVQERFAQMEKRAYLLIDHSQIKKPIVFQALELFYVNKRKEPQDEWDLKMQYYTQKLETYFETTIWKYDANMSGDLDYSSEESVTSRITWHR